jgi:hypothetical protein
MTFLNPWYLLGTVLAIVPILIHLWFRKRLKKIPFSTLQFLKRTEARRFGWLRLREWLVLMLRCFLIVFLFLSLARPQLRSGFLKIGRLASVLLIIDNSYSMGYGGNFEMAKDFARQVISRYSTNSEFCIVPLCERADADESFWMMRKSALARLQKTKLTHAGGSISTALASAPAREPKYEVEYIYIGDGQSSNFKNFSDDATARQELYWVMVPAGSNVGISRVSLKDPVAIPSDKYNLLATISSYSSRVWSGKIGVTSGDFYLERDCSLNPRVIQDIEFVLPVAALSGKMEIFDDSLSTDNAYFFSKPLPRSIRVLLVGDSPYIIHALTSGNASSLPFLVDATTQLGDTDLRRYDVIILAGLQEISEVDKIRLMNHRLEPGSALITILGKELGENLRDFLSGCCRVGKSVSPKGYVTLDWIDETNSLFGIFGGGGALRDVQYFRYTQVEADEGVLARFAGGDPFLIACDNMAVLTGLLDPRSTNFVYKSAFVPVILRLIVSLVSEPSGNELYVGDRVPASGTVRTPAGELLLAEEALTMPGFHFIDGETLCVNVRAEEGDLRILGSERADILNVQRIEPGRDLMGSDLSQLFLILALMAIILELGLLFLR